MDQGAKMYCDGRQLETYHDIMFNSPIAEHLKTLNVAKIQSGMANLEYSS